MSRINTVIATIEQPGLRLSQYGVRAIEKTIARTLFVDSEIATNSLLTISWYI